MQVKKFEAPTIQEALEAIKREIGPDAVVLQTRKNKKGFGLLSKSSVEVTVAVTDRAIQKKRVMDKVLSTEKQDALYKLPAAAQSKVFDKVQISGVARQVANVAPASALRAALPEVNEEADEQIYASRNPSARTTSGNYAAAAPVAAQQANRRLEPKKRITATRYVDILDGDEKPVERVSVSSGAAGAAVNAALEQKSIAHDNLEAEVQRLKMIVEDLKSAKDDPSMALDFKEFSLTQALQDCFEQLTVNGMDRRYALNLIRQTRAALGETRSANVENVLDQLAIEIMESTETVSLLSGIRTKQDKGFSTDPAYIAFVGPTGVGKTTTIAKVASEAKITNGLKVGLINVDCYKVAAHDQLATYAKILNVPFRSVATREELDTAVQDFAQFDLILIDTTGRSQRDVESLQKMKHLLSGIPGLRTELVLAATTREQELYEMGTRFAIFKPEGVIVSKLDEASMYGAVYNVSHRLKLPLMYFTTGQRVPEDLEEASRERVVSLVMDL